MSCVCSYSWIFTEAIRVKYLRHAAASQLGFQPSGHKSAALNIAANWAVVEVERPPRSPPPTLALRVTSGWAQSLIKLFHPFCIFLLKKRDEIKRREVLKGQFSQSLQPNPLVLSVAQKSKKFPLNSNRKKESEFGCPRC